MQKLKPQLARLLYIDQQIARGRYPNATSMAKDYEVSDRTIKRDIEYFRDQLNAPICYDSRKRGYFYEDSSYRFSPVTVQEKDVFALFLADKVLAQYENTPLHAELSEIFNKFADLLPYHIRVRSAVDADQFSVIIEPSAQIDPDTWITVFDSLRRRVSLKFQYRVPGQINHVSRRIDPYHVFSYRGEWYVISYCHYNKDRRTYAFSRMSSLELTDETFDLPSDFDAESHFRDRFGITSGADTQEVRIHFAASQAPYVREREWKPGQHIEEGADGSIVLSFRTALTFELKRWVLSWGAAATVLAPESLRGEIHREVSDGTKNYAE